MIGTSPSSDDAGYNDENEKHANDDDDYQDDNLLVTTRQHWKEMYGERNVSGMKMMCEELRSYERGLCR